MNYIKINLKQQSLLFKASFSIILIFTLISYVLPQLQNFLINVPYLTINNINLWRLITSLLITRSLVSFLIQLVLCSTIFSLIVIVFQLKEKKISTVVFIINFFAANLCIQLAFCLIAQVIYWIQPNTHNKITTFGLLPIYFVYLVRICEAEPQGNINILCFQQIKKKYYSAILLIAVTILFNGIVLDIYIAYTLSLIELRWFKGNCFKFSKSFYQKIEKLMLCSFLNQRNYFYKIENCPQSQYFFSSDLNPNVIEFYAALYDIEEQIHNQIDQISSQQSNLTQNPISQKNMRQAVVQTNIEDSEQDKKNEIVTVKESFNTINIEEFRNHWINNKSNQRQELKVQLIQQEEKEK